VKPLHLLLQSGTVIVQIHLFPLPFG